MTAAKANAGDTLEMRLSNMVRGPVLTDFASTVILVLSLILARVDAAHSMSLADLLKLGPDQWNMSIDGAGDGSMLAVGWNGRVILVNLTGSRKQTDLGPGFDPVWAPGSQRLAFFSQRSGTLQLWLWERGDNRLRQVTRDARGVDVDATTRAAGSLLNAFRVTWSPDGERLAFASRRRVSNAAGGKERRAGVTQGAEAPIVLTNSSPPGLTLKGILVNAAIGYGGVPFTTGSTIQFRRGKEAETQIRVVDVISGAQRWVTSGAYSHFQPAWSPDGTLLACVSVRGAGLTGQSEDTEIEVLGVPSGPMRQLTQGRGVKVWPTWLAPDGRLVFMQSSRTFTWPKFYSMNVASGHAAAEVPVLAALNRRILNFRWSPSLRDFLVTYRDGVSNPLARLRPHSAAVVITRAAYPLAVYDFTTFARGAVAWIQADPQNLWTLRYLPRSGHHAVILVRLTSTRPGTELGHAEIVKWRNRRGETLTGTILLPPGFVRGVRYPLIVDAYPLMSGNDWTSPMFGNYAWAAEGYVIFRPSPPAPIVWNNPWTTEASSGAAKGPKGWRITIDDVTSGVNHLVADGLVDQNRVCLYGFSNGGGVVDYLVTQVHRYRCAVSVAPAFSDLVRPFLLSSQDQVSWINGGKQLDAGLKDYITLSAVFHLSSVQTPMLIADGDEDGDFLLNSVEMYNQLRQLGRRVTLLRYPDQGHGLSGRALGDFWERELAFFARYLAPQEHVSGIGRQEVGRVCSGCLAELP